LNNGINGLSDEIEVGGVAVAGGEVGGRPELGRGGDGLGEAGEHLAEPGGIARVDEGRLFGLVVIDQEAVDGIEGGAGGRSRVLGGEGLVGEDAEVAALEGAGSAGGGDLGRR